MTLKDIFKTDSQKEQEGVWVTISENADGTECRFRLAMMGPSNKKYVAAATGMRNKYRHRMTTLSEAKQTQLVLDVFISTILLGWENVEEYRESNMALSPMMPFTVENAKFLLTDLPKLYDLLVAEAQDFSNFAVESANNIAKN